MLATYEAEVRSGRIDLIGKAELPEGAHVLVTVLNDQDKNFWMAASTTSLDKVWNNDEDDVYAALLPK